jgi:hypothetical protein
MEPVSSRVAETAHLSLRTLARETRPSDDSLRGILPEPGSSGLLKSAFTSAI